MLFRSAKREIWKKDVTNTGFKVPDLQAITDTHVMASYDQVAAGPRFAVSGRGQGVETLADEDEGLVSLPHRFTFAPVTAGTGTLG